MADQFKRDPKYRLYIRLDGYLQPVAGSSVYRYTMPKNGRWVDITDCTNLCCTTSTTTTTTTTTLG